MSENYLTFAIDSLSAGRLAGEELRMALLGTEDDAYLPWMEAINRGFHEPRPTPEFVQARAAKTPHRRMTGVWDATLADPTTPVATASSWPTELTVPGGKSVTSWAISTITVAPTHRRRGIAGAMLGAELRTARALGVPVAILTASEATIYRRWGFAPAAMIANWTIDPRRVTWTGPRASGRVQYVGLEQLLVDGHTVVEAARLATPGLIHFDGQLWERMLGIGDEELSRRMRFLRYDDAGGMPKGFAIYSVLKDLTHSGRSVIEVHYLSAVTDEAYAGLWRFLFELDLVGEVRAPMRPVEEPFAWQISDYRAAVKSNEHDHLWARILDLPAALEARSYSAPGRILFEVTDPLGFAAGRWLLAIDQGGTGTVTRLADDAAPDAESPDAASPRAMSSDAVSTSVVSLGVNELSSLYLGGVSAALLARAGAITERTPDAATAIDASFRSDVAPWLSIWF
jgi:predicted acetyltransferase